jgi:hypothetical protein
MKPNHNLNRAIFALAGLLAGAALPLPAQNLIVNGSFSDGTFGSWNTSSADGSLTVDNAGNIGIYATGLPDASSANYALFTPSTDTSSLDQSFATLVGTTYDITFWVNDSYGNSSLVVDANTQNLLTVAPGQSTSSAGNGGWQEVEFFYTATSPTTDLSFVGNTGSFLGVDAISVVPEPGTLTLVGLGAAALVLVRRARRQ